MEIISLEIAAKEEICQLCTRGIEDVEVRLREIENVVCILCRDCLDDENKSQVVKLNIEEGFLGQTKVSE